MDQINRSKAVFEALPSVLRKRFDNDPAKFLDFVQDSNNSKELVEMGLAVSKEDIKAAQKRETEGTPVLEGNPQTWHIVLLDVNVPGGEN